MIINGIQCSRCGDILYSRARHDFHYCSCGNTFVDGGFDYLRCGWTEGVPIDVEIEIEATIQELYEDWNKEINNYGVIYNDC